MAWRAAAVILLLMLAAIYVAASLAPPAGERDRLTAREAGDAGRGAALFREHCTACHGNDLLGTERGPSLLHSYYKPAHHADLAIRLAVRDGVVQHHWHFGNMPPVPAVAGEADHLVAFIRHEQRQAGLIP